MSKRKIDFICAGAQKSGTTTLFNMLSQHPSVYMPRRKELYFFDDERNFKKGYIWYESLFEEDSDLQVKGDITPDYILFPKCAKRILNYNPDVKILIMLRNPADRAFSHYQMKKRDTEENKSFSEALKSEAERTGRGYRSMMKYSYLQRGFYYKQLKPYFDLFPPENIKIIIFEEFIKDIINHMGEIEMFLEIPCVMKYDLSKKTNEGYLPKRRYIAYIKRHLIRPVRGIYNKVIPQKIREKVSHATDAGILPKENLAADIRTRLMAIYHDDIKNLENLINRDLSLWFLFPPAQAMDD